MRVLNNKFVRVSLIVCLILSMTLTSAFAASYSVPYAEPPTTDNAGYVSLAFSSGNVITYWWNCQAGTTDTKQVSPVVNVNLTDTTINFTFTCVPNTADYVYNYNLSRRTGTLVWLMSSGASNLSNTTYHDFSSLGTVSAITYGGNIGSLSGFSSLGSASIQFETSSISGDFYSKIDAIYTLLLNFNNNNYDNLQDIIAALGKLDKLDHISNQLVNFNNNNYDNLRDIVDAVNDLNANVTELTINNQKWLGYIFDRLELTNVRLTSILAILNEFKATTLEESTAPLPSQGLVDFESSQGSLRNDSDVSNNLDSVFNDVDFGSFSNGFNVIWSLVDSVLNTHPIFFSLVILVLTLGLLNLIFNRR